MRSRLLILCPGQGAQHAQMFELARGSARAAALLDSFTLPSASDPALMFSNRAAQQLIVAGALAMWEALRGDAPAPALVAGYSVGELAAYGVAGALGGAELLELAALRAAAMDDCRRAHPGQALAAISGLSLPRAAGLMADDLFYIAIETADDSCIAGGPAAGLAALEHKVVAAGARLTRLPVELASHTPYLAAAVAPFAAALHGADFQPFTAPVLSGIAALRVDGKALAVDQLSRQLAEPILWRGCMDAGAEAGITVALELGPGAALSKMLQARHPQIACRSVADFRSLAGVRRWLEQHCG
ncbi:acyltransferase domain-containing protein [Rugamonas sp.]|uniref:acyltransferase domain-containing protein n=1 Tax=Rugamonas sp. TaxID=1926287 RepID=UPI0025F1E453|nr:acyltransferase domain-containing protein [Rugamonas sp.]